MRGQPRDRLVDRLLMISKPLFMQANGSQLRELSALYDSGKLRPIIDRTFPFDETLEAMAHVEQGRTTAGKVVVSMIPDQD